MARTVRDAKLETRKAREALKVQKEPYWRLISQKAHIGYYKGTHATKWFARLRLDNKKTGSPYIKTQIGKADDVQDADGVTIFNFYQAQEKARAWFHEQEQKAKGYIPHKPLTLADAADNYLSWFKDHRKGYNETKLAIHAHILPYFGDKLVTDLTTKSIKDWRDKLAATPARKRSKNGKKQEFRDAPQTDEEKRARKASVNRTLSILKAMLNKAFQDELVSDDLMWRRVKPFEKADEPRIRFLTETECQRLINASRPDFRQLVCAALFTGARYSELTNLEAKDVNLDTKQVYIKPAKSGKGRYIPLSAQGESFFRSHLAGKTGSQKVFTKEIGSKPARTNPSDNPPAPANKSI